MSCQTIFIYKQYFMDYYNPRSCSWAVTPVCEGLTRILVVYAELMEMLLTNTSSVSGLMASGSGTVLWCVSPTYACTTVIRFMVSVPVLSEQMAVALPMVSQASR